MGTTDAERYARLAEKFGIADEEPNYAIVAAIRGQDEADRFRREYEALRAAAVGEPTPATGDAQ